MKNISYLFLLFVHLLLLSQNNKIPPNSKKCFPCSNEELQRFEKANSQLQLLVHTPNRETINPNLAAVRFTRAFAYKNWFPLAAEKQTLCGLIGHFNVHKAITSKERDHNFRIIPKKGFEYLLNEAEQFKENDKDGLGNWHDCNGGINNCMESEITPSMEFRAQNGEEYFQLGVDHEVCAYGPWVRERLHNHRPEIHPAETIWYNVENSLRIMIFQDASMRYNKSNRFAYLNKLMRKSEPKEPKQVWVEDTLKVIFSLYFEFENESNDTLSYNFKTKAVSKHLDQVFKKDNTEISLILKNGQAELDYNLEGLGVDFKELVFCEEGGEKKGLLTFETTIFRVRKEYGYLVLDVEG